MKIKPILFIMALSLIMGGCHKGPPPKGDNMAISHSKNAPGDSTIYGLCCPSSSDTSIVILPNAGGDPITFSIKEAQRKNQIFGSPGIGDWVGIITDAKDKHKATMVVDLDQIKGTWTYQVMPHLRDYSNLSKEQQNSIIADMPDSVIETYMIPREYGFTLKRQGVARPVGLIRNASALEDDSPVEYPPIPMYLEWKAYNGHILLKKGRINKNTGLYEQDEDATPDTFHLVYMQEDTLVMRVNANLVSFHRQADAKSANAKASAIAAKQAAKTQSQLK